MQAPHNNFKKEINLDIVAINKNEIIKPLITYKESFLDSLVNKKIEMWDLR
ncbi:MAG: hypothetical protein ABIH92_01275 [Nanoarchaeota archaeon]